MPTKLEDVATPKCKSFKRFNALLISESSGLLGGIDAEHWSNHPAHYERTQLIRLEDAETLEKELHVAREETKEAHASHGKTLLMCEITINDLKSQLTTANQKCQLVDELVVALKAFGAHRLYCSVEKYQSGTCDCGYQEALPKAAKTL